MSRFLLATWDGGGTIPPELGLTAELVDRGHEVVVLSDDTVARRPRPPGPVSPRGCERRRPGRVTPSGPSSATGRCGTRWPRCGRWASCCSSARPRGTRLT